MSRVEHIPEFVENLPEVELPVKGARGWLLQGEDKQVVFVEFGETAEVPEHRHAAQWEHAIAGRVDLRMNGATTTYTSGESFLIEAGVPHGATVHAGYTAMIIFDEADRYRAKPRAK